VVVGTVGGATGCAATVKYEACVSEAASTTAVGGAATGAVAVVGTVGERQEVRVR